MAFKVATAFYYNKNEEVRLKFSKEYENSSTSMKIDYLSDIIYYAKLKYKEEIKKLSKMENNELITQLLGLPNDASQL